MATSSKLCKVGSADGGNKSAISLYAELKPNLSAMQVVLQFDGDRSRGCGRGVTTVTVGESSITVTCEKRVKCDVTFDLHPLKFLPKSCRGLQWVGDSELHFRIQTTTTARGQVPPVILEGAAVSSSVTAALKVYERPDFSCSCRSCGQEIIGRCTFRRVLPLPSEKWYDDADSWFCHKPITDPSHPVNTPCGVTPRQGDCLVADSHFVVCRSSLAPDGAVIDTNGCRHKAVVPNVKCRRCGNTVGRQHHAGSNKCPQENGHVKLPGAVRLYTHSLSLHAHGPQHVEDSADFGVEMAEILLHQRHQYNSFRFIVETTDPRDNRLVPYILLTVLDSNTLLYTGHMSGRGVKVKVTPRPVLKLLYRDCIRRNTASLADKWNKDLTVHSLNLPEHMCCHLLDALASGTTSLPKSLRHLDGFYVGCLHTRQLDAGQS
ncbi:hypothetical protein LSAT2_026421 [Lamellibrachia satsuma]|nr:hypothetical protein LSAT2_026421 [Lamellibrachia satsuma]